MLLLPGSEQGSAKDEAEKKDPWDVFPPLSRLIKHARTSRQKPEGEGGIIGAAASRQIAVIVVVVASSQLSYSLV